MDNYWNKNKLLGNITEDIVEFLINSMPDWRCNRFGVETHINDIKDRVKNYTNPITLKIRKMPDFVAFNEKTREISFIEVKYSSNSKGDGWILDSLEDYNKYWSGTKLIIVCEEEPYFVYVDLSKINQSMKKTKETYKGPKDFWDFGENEKSIKDLFPDLKEEDIEEAIKRIPK